MKYYCYKRLKSGESLEGVNSLEGVTSLKSIRIFGGATNITDGKGGFGDVFEEQKDGKFKCLLCNTYTIPRMYKGNYIYYNLEDNMAHRQKQYDIKRKRHEWLCCVPDSKIIEIKRRMGRLKVKHDKNNFLWVEPE